MKLASQLWKQVRYYQWYNYGHNYYTLYIPVSAAPDGPPTSFDLVVINSTAIEALWELPGYSVRNGIIRGYKLFVQSQGRDIKNITITNNQTLAYIVGGLKRGTPYTFSILAYTVADGPRSIHLTAITLCECSNIVSIVPMAIKDLYNSL